MQKGIIALKKKIGNLTFMSKLNISFMANTCLSIVRKFMQGNYSMCIQMQSAKQQKRSYMNKEKYSADARHAGSSGVGGGGNHVESKCDHFY